MVVNAVEVRGSIVIVLRARLPEVETSLTRLLASSVRAALNKHPIEKDLSELQVCKMIVLLWCVELNKVW